MTPEMIRDALYAGACVYWPDLTPKQYGDAARAAVASFDPSGSISLGELEKAIRGELISRYGAPAVPFEGRLP